MAIHNSRLSRKKPISRRKEPINKVTDERREQLAQYSVEAAQYKLDNPFCMVCPLFFKHNPLFPIQNCTNKTAHIHHQWGKEDDKLLMKEFWLTTCEFGHDYELTHPLEAYAAGVSIKRNIIIH